MLASLQHIIAVAGGMKKKGGGSLSIYDFAPQLKDREDPEAKMKKVEAQFKLMAARSEMAQKKSGNQQVKGIVKNGGE